jgi:hypothetical protein
MLLLSRLGKYADAVALSNVTMRSRKIFIPYFRFGDIYALFLAGFVEVLRFISGWPQNLQKSIYNA